MARILKEGCKWKIDGPINIFTDVENKTFDSEQELDLALLAISRNAFESQAIFQSVNTKESVKKTLEEIQSKISSISKEITILGDDPDDVETFYKIPNSIGVTKFLTNVNKPGDTKPFVTPFNKDRWMEQRIAQLSTEMSESEARVKVNEEVESWDVLQKSGTAIHSIFESIFKGESPTNNGLPEEVYNQVVKDIRNFKMDLEERYPDADFYPELPIVSRELSDDTKDKLGDSANSINGRIDLLVVDKDGFAHLYDFKVSRKGLDLDSWGITDNSLIPNDQWKSSKKLATKYQLAFYAAMLKQYGIEVIDTNIVPVKLDLTYNDEINKIGIKSVDGAAITPVKSNVEGTLSGRERNLIQQVLKHNTVTTSDEVTKLSDIYSHFFPENSTLNKIRTSRSKADYYKKQDRFTKKLVPTDKNYSRGQWRFQRLNLDNKFVYCETEEKLDEAILAYIDELGDKHSNLCLNLANRIEKVYSGALDAEQLMDDLPKSSRAWASNQFRRYFEDGWEFNNDPTQNAMGVFMFIKNGIAELISIEDGALDTLIGLGKGTTILGKTKRDKFVDKKRILASTNGNLALMKLMTYVANNQDKFDGYRISEVRAINFGTEQEMTALNSKLIDNYNELCRANPDSGSEQIKSKLFTGDVQGLVESANSRLRTINFDLGGMMSAVEQDNLVKWTQKMIDGLKEKFPQLYSKKPNFEDPVWQAYSYLYEANLAAKGYSTTQEEITGDIVTRGLRLNGLMVASPQFSPSTNLREFASILQSYENRVAGLVFERAHKFRQLVDKLYKEKGAGVQAFENMYERDATGLDKRLILKDPDEMVGTATEKAVLREFLEQMWKLRNPDATEQDSIEAKASKEYYEVPLMEAVISRQLKARIKEQGFFSGVAQAVTDKFRQYANLSQEVFAEDEKALLETRRREDELGQFGELSNKFDLNGFARQQKLTDHSLGFFETHLELIFNNALVAYTKSEVSQEYIPIFQAMRLSLLRDKDTKGTANEEVLTTFNKMVKSKFYNESIVKKELQPLLKWLNVVRKTFTTMSLAFNVTSFLRESLQGIYTGVSRSAIKMLPGVDEKNYIKGLTHVIKEAHKNFSSVSLLQQLNSQYQMANQSLSQLANQRRVNWLNIKNWGRDTMFLTATAPDFMHRVSILVAKMMGDGCWEAHSLVDGKLVYDYNKDHRFDAFRSGDTSHKDYLAQKSLYYKMMDDFKQEGFTREDGSELEYGDALPQAYTTKEAQSIKNFADLMYGHYDDSSRSLLVDTFLGSFIMQYKTYITAKFEQWMMPEGVYNTELLKQQFDPVTGEALYSVITEDEDGFHRDIIRESALTEEQKKDAVLYYDYEGIPMQGLLQETWQFTKDILSFDKEKWDNLMSDPTRKGYLYLALHDQMIMALLMFLATFFFGEMTEANKPLDPTSVGRKVREMGPLTQVAYNVIQGSTMDAQFLGLSGNSGVIGNMVQNPPMVTAVQRFVRTNWQMITGKSSLPYVASQNIGMIRSFQGTLKNLNEE